MTPPKAKDGRETLQERLRAFNKCAPSNCMGECVECPHDLTNKAASALDAAQARIKELEKALEPFALYATVSDAHAMVNWGDHISDTKVVSQVASELTDPAVLRVGDFRRAREALAALQPLKKEAE